MLLHSAAAFDIVDHNVLLDCMLKQLQLRILEGFREHKTNRLSWFQLYLIDRRSPVVQIDGCVSKIMWSNRDRYLGPLLFSIYSEPISDTAHKHGINMNTYADDTVIFVI